MRKRALLRRWGLALSVASALAGLGGTIGMPASAKTFRWANAGDTNSMDPYGRNETFLLQFNANIYEGLLRRGKDLKLEPALAVKWGKVSPTRWFFELRQGVTFHDGTKFTADDVVFSFGRANHDNSGIRSYFASVKEAVKVSDTRVEFETKYPDPLLDQKFAQFAIMSKAWCEKNNTTVPADLRKNEESYASRNANGTGPFVLKDRKAGERTILVPNPTWWDKPEHNLTEVIFSVVANPATRVAALKAGDIDMMYEVPPQDTDSLKRDANLKVIEGPETRVVYFGFDHLRDELPESNIKGRNPLKDKRVREVIYRSIDIEAIKRTVMRGQSYPTALMVAPGINGYVKDLDKRPSLLKPEEAKKKLAEAGYPNGFEISLDCPNDRYVNDEKICQATVSMLAKAGIKVNLLAQTRLKFFAKIALQTTNPVPNINMYMLGWSPGSTYDVHNVFEQLIQCYNLDRRKGQTNNGRYCNPKFDALADKIEQEIDPEKRDEMIREATAIYLGDYAYIPLHQQAIIWAARKNIELHQSPDNYFPLRFVKVK
ncbi:ABC transporter substrate-binding protein [Reyranella sp. CPCC 100927]|uniref:ABC transporter substrate-binding protein n=1 Tax=Reyranella sp. CPCC 100927 TaxID=2599616 RepID=UPI0011B54512|nr:ABC transporter substrate-binding protein [Reyranella sp. CPCC 100927]TWT09429.1 ABC transporter substrate-binding protein [Reyranella sp. CPCC 100927]